MARLPYLVALRKPRDRQIRIWGLSVVIVALASVSGCSAIPGGGPGRISATALETNGIEIVTITNAVSEKLVRMQRRGLFSEALGSDGALLYTVGRGDTLEVSVWEAPPALLFGASPADLRANGAPLRATTFPEQVVSAQGTINIPFVGVVPVEGRALQDVESDIVERLKGKANQAQATVRLVRNSSLNVTIVGEVASSLRMPLTPRGERLLDALAAAGGVRQPVHKTSVQITRRGRTLTLPLETIIRDPEQNVPLRTGDVVTVLHQPLSLTVLGAVAKNEELSFEAQGISLAQALGRIGGLMDQRADASGVFVFRFERTDPDNQPMPSISRDERIPVVYTINLREPAALFFAQRFPMQHGDVLYVANSPASELQKFLNLLGSVIYPLDVVNRIRQ